MSFKDFSFSKGEYGKAAEYYDDDAIILAIRNILLSKPGNYPMTPSLGMNIKKYKFELLDNNTINSIQTELNRNIATYIPDLKNIRAEVRKVEDNNANSYLCFAIYDGSTDMARATFVLSNDGDLVNVFNEEH